MATVSGRIANVLTSRAPGLAKWSSRVQVDQYRRSNGMRFNKLRGRPVFLLDVVGRSSGESRPVMLMVARRGDDLIVVGSNGGHAQSPNWWKNLMAAGEAHVEVGGERWVVDAREVDGDEKAECWEIACAAYPDFASYQELTDRTIPVVELVAR